MDSEFSSHPLHTTVGLILARRDNPEFTQTILLEESAYAAYRDRVFAVIGVLRAALRSIPAPLASIPLMNQMETACSAVLEKLIAFQSDNNIGHLSAASSYIDSNVQPPLSAFMLGGGAEAINATLPAIMEQHTKYAKETLEHFSKMRSVSFNELESLGMRAHQIEEQLRKAEETLMHHRVAGEAAVSRLEILFNEQEKIRDNKNQELLSTFRSDYAAFDEESKRFNEHHVGYLQEKKDEAARLVELIGTIGATGNYQKIANAEAKQANIWRRITIGFFVAGVGLAIATFVKHWEADINTETALSILVKLLYAVVITTPAWYAARESARHRTLADRARQAELELASIGPFIELMPDTKKVEIREHLAKLYFGRTVENHSVEALFDGKTLKELAVELAKAFKKEESKSS